MSVDYNQLKALVKEAMFTGGGINEPSAPEGVSSSHACGGHRRKRTRHGRSEGEQALCYRSQGDEKPQRS